MSESSQKGRIPLRLSRGSVIASLQTDVTPDVVAGLQQDALRMIGVTRAHGFVVDLSGVDMLEPDDFHRLLRTMEMAKLMGAQPMLCGLRAGVVSALVDLDADLEQVNATRTIDDALDALVGHEEEGETAPRRRVPVVPREDLYEANDSDPE